MEVENEPEENCKRHWPVHFERNPRFPVRDDFCVDLIHQQTGSAAVYLRGIMEDGMNDLISRSAAKDEILSWAVLINKPHLLSKEDALYVLDTLPAVDAVSRKVVEQIMWERDTAMEQLKKHGIPFGGIAPDVVAVVRCKKCKHNNAEKALRKGGIWCEYWGTDPDPDDFCKRGERRDDDAKPD